MSATVHDACGSPSDRGATAVPGRFRHPRSVRSVAGPLWFCRGGRALFKAGWLLAGFLGLNVLLANEPIAPPAQTERGAAQEPPDKSDSPPKTQPEPGKASEPASPDTESKTAEPAKPDPTPPAPEFKRVKRDDFASVFSKVVPTSLADLDSIQQHVEALTTQVSPAVVAVRVGFATGSGVVISQDGTVLSAAHVCVSPGRDVVFTFPDGKTARGKTLGTNHEIDAGLMKITDPGPWPHTEVGELEYARLGDWVLALGHPGGFDRKRPIVARLGRIIRLVPGVVQSDCTLIGGDSGGPLFDMHGRVIGIHSRISDSTAANFHVPIGTFHETWDRLAKGESWGDQRSRPPPSVGAGGVADPAGCKLDRVDEGGAASRAGLKVGDIVMKVNGQEVKDFDSFLGLVRQSRRGEELTLVVKREDKEMTIKMRLGFGGRGR